MTEMSDATNALAKVLLPVIRNVMPSIIAHDIIGSQNMIGPAGIIWGSSRSGFYAPYIPNHTKVVTDEHYRHFLRLNNRKRRWSVDDLLHAGYPEATVVGDPVNPQEQPFLARQWCLENIDEGRFVRFANRYFFANDTDAIMFKMRWS